MGGWVAEEGLAGTCDVGVNVTYVKAMPMLRASSWLDALCGLVEISYTNIQPDLHWCFESCT